MARKSDKPSFEKALQELEALVESLEAGDLSLEESLKSFERGMALSNTCQRALAEAEQKVEILTERQGKTKRSAFPDAED